MKIKSSIQLGKCSKNCHCYMSSYFIFCSKVPSVETQPYKTLNLEGTLGTILIFRYRKKKLRCTDEEEFISCRWAVGKSMYSHHFRSVAQSSPTLCDPMNRSTPGLPVHHQLPEFTQTHVHRVSDAIQPSHPLLSPYTPARNSSQHQRLFQ